MASRANMREALNQGSRGSTEGGARTRLRGLLVVFEVALAMVLLAGAGLFVRSFLRLAQADAGFVPAGATSMVIGLRGERYAQPEQQLAFANALLARLRSLPDVQAAGLANMLPLNYGIIKDRDFVIEGRPEVARTAMPRTSHNVVSPDYLRAMGIRLLRGRDFTEHDNSAAPGVAIINETLARQHFPNEDPLGRRIQTRANVWHEIVGIAADASPGSTTQPMTAQMYEPYAQLPTTTSNFIIRTTGSLAALNSELAAQVRAVDKDIPIYRIKTLEEGVNDSNASRRIAMLMLAVFSAAALLLAAVGLYGVISYYVSQRTNEIGIRIALGASTRDVLRLVLGHGCRLVGLGLAIGLVASLVSGRMIEGLLFSTSGRDPFVLSTIMLLLAGVALLAVLLPTRRALKVDPMVALRCE
jgi:putative ABC transport system permease protein